MKNAHKQRAKQKEYARSCTPGRVFRCPNCEELTTDGHYVPASFGDPPFWVCGAGAMTSRSDGEPSCAWVATVAG